jgi:NADP-dependent 3-hydroxy acid dehydrogenase YdfG
MSILADQVAIITGGGTGIGQGISLALAEEGVNVVISGRRFDPLQKTCQEIKNKTGRNCLVIQGDVSDEMDVEKIVQQTLAAFGKIDILVNNAGISGGEEIHRQEVADWDQTLSVNLRGPFLMARAVLPKMRAQQHGEIVNISSESGIEHYSGDGVYGVSKHALNELSEYIQRENQSFNIRVHTICPGMVVTEMTRDAPGLNHQKCLYPEDIAELAIFLLTRRSNIKIGTPILIQTMLNPWE